MPVSFTPHLLPVDRGILSHALFPPAGRLPRDEAWLSEFRDFYAGEPFVEVTDTMPGLSEVAYTNYCRLTVREDRAAGWSRSSASSTIWSRGLRDRPCRT